MVGDLFLQTRQRSTNIFALADGHPTPATNIVMLECRLREPAPTLNMIPALANYSLLSGGKFLESGYVSVCNGYKVNIYNGHIAEITVS